MLSSRIQSGVGFGQREGSLLVVARGGAEAFHKCQVPKQITNQVPTSNVNTNMYRIEVGSAWQMGHALL